MSYIALEFFSGIGGLHTALKKVSPESSVVCSYDINPNAYLVYQLSNNYNRIDIITIIQTFRIFKRTLLESRTFYCYKYC